MSFPLGSHKEPLLDFIVSSTEKYIEIQNLERLLLTDTESRARELLAEERHPGFKAP